MSQLTNPCPVLAGIAKAIVPTMSAEQLAELLKTVELSTLQHALVLSGTIGVDPAHLKLAIDHGMIDKETVLDAIGHTDSPVSLKQAIEDSPLYDIMDALTTEYAVEDIMDEFSDHVDSDSILDYFCAETLGNAAESKDDDWCDLSQVAQSDLFERIDWDSIQAIRALEESTVRAWLDANPTVADELCCKTTVLRWIDQNTRQD